MNDKSSESSAKRTEGKSYGLQRPQESAPDTSGLQAQKQKIVDAVGDFIDAFLATTGAGASGGGSGSGLGTGTGDTTPPPSDTGGGTGSPGGTGSTNTYTGTGEQPHGEAAQQQSQPQTEALESASIKVQREAFNLDRARESEKRARRRETGRGDSAAGPAILTLSSNKHLSDSNSAPLTESREFPPMFGSLGKPTATTIEKMAVPTARPESAPSATVASYGRPLDAYYGSFGTAIERAAARAQLEYTQLEVIIGTDDRVRVTNNTLYPWRCVCSLLITANTGAQYVGTGWLVSPRLVLTAGHCVYMADQNGWASQIEVIPGRNGTERPFGSAISRELRSVSGWTQDNDSDYDYGAIILPADKRFGEQLGWFGYATRDEDYLRSATLNLAGYPGDGGKAGQQVDGSQWYNSRGVKDVHERQITYEIDTYGGQSGAPVWEFNANGNRYGVGIHTWGTSIANGATRITGNVFDNIVLWVGQAP